MIADDEIRRERLLRGATAAAPGFSRVAPGLLCQAAEAAGRLVARALSLV